MKKLHEADLVELIYALHCGGGISNGQADLKGIATSFEQFFQIELGNIYNTFREICMRKKGQTKFLDHLKSMLQKKIDESI